MEKNKVAFISDLMLAAVALIWGLGFPVTQMAIDAQLSSGLIVALRFLIAASGYGDHLPAGSAYHHPAGCPAGLCSRADPGHGVPAAGHGAEHDHPFQFGLPHIAQCHYCAVSELGLLPSASHPQNAAGGLGMPGGCPGAHPLPGRRTAAGLRRSAGAVLCPWHSRCTSPTWVGLPDASR